MPATRATVTALTLRVYDRLPQLFRDADEAVDGLPLLTWLACLLDQLGAVDALVDRWNFIPRDEVAAAADTHLTSDLVDPLTGDPAWLPWQALIYGTYIDLAAAVATQRAQVDAAETWWARGSHDSLVAAAQTALTGTKTVTLTHPADWTIGIQVIGTEVATTDAAVIAAVDAADARPAGHDLTVIRYVSSWDTQEAAYPTWTAREAAGSWDVIESVH